MLRHVSHALSVIGLATSIAFVQPALADSSSRTISKPVQRLMQVSGLDQKPAETSSAIVQMLDRELSADPSQTDTDKQLARQAAEYAWSTEQLANAVARAFDEALTVSDVGLLVDYYESPFGRHVKEEMDAKDPLTDPQGFADFQVRYPQLSDHAERTAVTASLVEETGMVEQSVVSVVDMQVALIRGLASVYGLTDADTDNMIQGAQASAPALRSQVEQVAPALFAWKTEGLSLDELDTILALSRQPEQRKMIAALLMGINHGLIEGAERFVEKLAELQGLDSATTKPEPLAADSVSD